MKQRVNIKTAKPDDALRVGDFALLPDNPQPPVITSHPIRNFSQLTWASVLPDGGLAFKEVNPIFDVFTVRKGTRVRFEFFCVDPSNVNNINDISSLQFVWKRDGNSLFTINNQNDGLGTTTIEFSEDQCTGEIEGEYVCEISNEFGTSQTVPFTLNVLDLDSSGFLYTNLVKNGDGELGLEHWTSASGKILSVVSNTSKRYNPNTMTRYLSDYPVIPINDPEYTPPLPFRFSTQTNKWQLFYPMYNTWVNSEPDLLNLDIPTSDAMKAKLANWYHYTSISRRVSIIPNEDINNENTPQGFFPAPAFIDRYNRNGNTQKGFFPLEEELKKGVRPTSYFTRDLIEFNEDEEHEFTQTIDISEAASLIDGQVGGVDYMTAQFFSYVGIALSRYKIRVIRDGDVVEYPWLVYDYESYKSFLAGGGVSPITCDPLTPIEIIPCTDDTTEISIKYFDQELAESSEEILKGPEAIDLWAVKEKVDIGLMLFPIYAFFDDDDDNDSGHDILIYGQKYTNTRALFKLLSEEAESGLGMFNDAVISNSTGPGGGTAGQFTGVISPNIDDINIRFLAKRYGSFYSQWNKAYPKSTWIKETDSNDASVQPWYIDIVDDKRKGLAVDQGAGAEAFFAVGRDIDIPLGTRQISITVKFKNDTPSRNDNSATSKNWNRTDIYNNLFSVEGTAQNVPQPYFAYGEPRCAITKMKLQLVPNRDIASEKHSTFTIPPNNVTVAGIAKNLIQQPLWNTAGKSEFKYKLIQPQPLPASPQPTLDTVESGKQDYTDAIDAGNLGEYTNPPSRFSPKEEADLGEAQINQEGIDFDKGDVDIEDP